MPVGPGADLSNRAITLVMPTAAGGAMDAFTRVIAEQMRVRLGQPVVIENISGR
jgi:tripartite-type tricarboxylate transporter receptor subunit TctC